MVTLRSASEEFLALCVTNIFDLDVAHAFYVGKIFTLALGIRESDTCRQ